MNIFCFLFFFFVLYPRVGIHRVLSKHARAYKKKKKSGGAAPEPRGARRTARRGGGEEARAVRSERRRPPNLSALKLE